MPKKFHTKVNRPAVCNCHWRIFECETKLEKFQIFVPKQNDCKQLDQPIVSEIQKDRSVNQNKKAYKLSFQLLNRAESVRLKSNKTHLIVTLLDVYGNFMLTVRHDAYTKNNRFQMSYKRDNVVIKLIQQMHSVNLSYYILLNTIQVNKIVNQLFKN